MKKIGKNQFECYVCKRIFDKAWTDEESKAEAEKTFGKPVEEWNDEAVVICDDCYQEVNPNQNPDIVAYAKKKI
jgi:hypothetical protein